MSGNIISRRVCDIVSTRWKPNHHHYGYYDLIPAPKPNLDKKDTGIFIFNRTQKQHLSIVEKDERFNILFKSKPCVNPVHEDEGPGNIVVVLEWKDKK